MLHTVELCSFLGTYKEFLSVLTRGLPQSWESGLLSLKTLNFSALKPFINDPLVVNTTCMLLLSFLCWVNSLATDNFSQVDRLWSILPFFYVAIFSRTEILKIIFRVIPSFSTVYRKFASPDFLPSADIISSQSIDYRLVVMLLLVTIWSFRLTYNFYRKGGYRSTYEDYRWVEVRKLFPPFIFQIFNLVFIALIQQILLLYLCTPAYLAFLSAESGATTGSRVPWAWTDTVATIGMSLTLLGEAVADQQQWRFQERKRLFSLERAKAAGSSSSKGADDSTSTGDLQRGFLSGGLFRFCRHPNFFCEISNWYFFFLFSVGALRSIYPDAPPPLASGAAGKWFPWFNWTVLGAVFLNALFLGSTWLTEKISASKYPAYAAYQRTTSRLWPWAPGPALH